MATEIVVLNETIDASIEEELLLDYEEDGEFDLISATAAFMTRHLKGIVGFCEAVVPSYPIDEFRSHFRTTKTNFVVLAKEYVGSLHTGNRTLSSSHVDADKNWHMAWNWSRMANGKYIFCSDIPFGNFGLPFKTLHLFLENFRLGKPK